VTEEETQSYYKDLEDLRILMSQDEEQVVAPCLGGIAHYETRDIGGREGFPEGPEWLYRGVIESCKDTYVLRDIPVLGFGTYFKVFECTERCVMSNGPVRSTLSYLTHAAFETLLKTFAHEHLDKVL